MNNQQEVYFSKISEEIINNLKTAKENIYIAVAWLTDKKIINTLLNLQYKGVFISLIIYNDKINKKQNFESLYNNGAEINLSQKMMHNKFCIIDNKILINGSYNWTNNAKTNEENIQVTRNNFDLIEKFHFQFNKLKKNCKNISYFFEDQESNFEIYFNNKALQKYPYIIIDINNYNSTIKRKFLVCDKNSEEAFLKYTFLKKTYFKEKELLLTDFSDLIIDEIVNFTTEPFTKINFNKDLVIRQIDTNIISPKTYNIFKISLSGEINKQTLIKENIHSRKKIFENIIIDKNKLFNINLDLIKEFKCDTIYKGDNDLLFLMKRKKIIGKNFELYGLANLNGNIIEPISFGNFKFHNDTLPDNFKYDKTYNTLFFIQDGKVYFYKEKRQFSENRTITSIPYINSKNQDRFLKAMPFFGSFVYKGVFNDAYEKSINEWKHLDDNELKIALINFFKPVAEKIKKREERCYIATLVYEDSSHPKVIKLRHFRDNILLEFLLGKYFVDFYYFFSPKLIPLLKNKTRLKKIIKSILNYLIGKIEKRNI